MKLLSFAIALGIGAASSTDLSTLFSSEESVVTLNARVHVATFDAYKDLEYNSGNCQIGADLRMGTATSGIKYWCEEGHFKE